MNRWIFLSLFCLGAISGCESKQTRHKIRGRLSDKAPETTHKAGERSGKGSVTPDDPDSSLLSLKSSRMAAIADVVGQDWVINDADQPHRNEVFWDSASDTRQYPELALFSDNTATADARWHIRMGKWKLDKVSGVLTLRWDNGSSKIYFMQGIAMKQMELSFEGSAGDSVLLKLSADALVHKRVAEDPFYPANNRWRIKPLAPESDEQLRRRVRDCVHFYALFFHDNNQRGRTEISFSGLPTCFIWYNGGIGMESKADLNQKWIDCFYSTYQALKGYEMLSSVLQRHVLKWPDHPTSWIRQTADVLDQFAGKL